MTAVMLSTLDNLLIISTGNPSWKCYYIEGAQLEFDRRRKTNMEAKNLPSGTRPMKMQCRQLH